MTNKVGAPLFYLGISFFGVYFLYNGFKMFSYRDEKGDQPIHETYQGGGSAVTKKKRHKRNKRNKGTKGKR